MLLLFAPSYRALRNSLPYLGAWGWFVNCPRWKHDCGLLDSFATRSRRMRSGGLHPREKYIETHEQLWESHFSSLSEREDPVKENLNDEISFHTRGQHAKLAARDVQRQTGYRGYTPWIGSNMPRFEFQSLCEQGQLNRAMDVLSSMDDQCTVASGYMFRSLLKVCALRKALAQAKRVQAHLVQHWVEPPSWLGECLVSTLVKCGDVKEANQVFDRLPQRTVYSWTALISGYTSAGRGHDALRMYRGMRQEGLHPDKYTFISLLRACGSLCDLEAGKRIHAEALKYGWGSDLFVGTCLVDMYAKCGSTVSAQMVFNGLPQRDVVSWNAMLAGYAQQGKEQGALELYEQMHEQGASPNNRTFVSALQACGMLSEEEEGVTVTGQYIKVNSLEKGRAIHADAWRKGFNEYVFVSNTLIRMYGKCGSIVDAWNVFDKLSMKDVVSWNAMLAAYVEQDQGDKALQLYQQMQEEGMNPDVRSFLSALQACGILAEKEDQSTKVKSLQQGKAIHADAWRSCYASNAFVASALVSLYGKAHSVADAQHVFDGLSHRDVVSWNAMLVVHVQQGQAEKALHTYIDMQSECASPDVQTFVSVLQACGMLAEKETDVLVDGQWTKVGALGRGKAVHADACKKNYHHGALVGNTLVRMYGKCGSLVDAQSVFDGLCLRNVVSWNAILGAYAHQDHGEQALQLYRQMQEAGISPDESTYQCVLQVCSSRGRLDICRQIHYAFGNTRDSMTPLLASSLIHAYGRCASMVDAQTVFDGLPQPDVVVWTALIAGYARQGDFVAGLQCYEEMQLAGIKPDGITYLSILAACSHAGLVDKGVEYFQSMSKVHGITPAIEHYASMADLLGRAGYWSRVEELLSTMPMQPDLAMWLGLLTLCRSHRRITLGKRAFDCAVRLQPKHAAAYVLMSNIYADAGLWDRAKELREEAGEGKKVGQTWVEYEQDVHIFVVGDKQHRQREQVYDLVDVVNFELNHEHPPQSHFVLRANVEEPIQEIWPQHLVKSNVPRACEPKSMCL